MPKGSFQIIKQESIKGSDDVGNYYDSHDELMGAQNQQREAWSAATSAWWDGGGYGGTTDDEIMVGDGGSEQDGKEGLIFLDRLLLLNTTATTNTQRSRTVNAIDVGAGVGRVTKLVLLKRFDTVRLIEPNAAFSKRSKAYLGRKRSDRCNFTCCKLENVTLDDFETWGLGTRGSKKSKICSGGNSSGGADLIWVQWTLQYMTDDDAIQALITLAGGLVAATGYLVVKENRPFGCARSDRFQMDTPVESGRLDITRPDNHHRFLFQRAGLKVLMMEQGDETNTYAVRQEE